MYSAPLHSADSLPHQKEREEWIRRLRAEQEQSDRFAMPEPPCDARWSGPPRDPCRPEPPCDPCRPEPPREDCSPCDCRRPPTCGKPDHFPGLSGDAALVGLILFLLGDRTEGDVLLLCILVYLLFN